MSFVGSAASHTVLEDCYGNFILCKNVKYERGTNLILTVGQSLQHYKHMYRPTGFELTVISG